MRRASVLAFLVLFSACVAMGAESPSTTADLFDIADEAIDALQRGWVGRYDMDWNTFVCAILGSVDLSADTSPSEVVQRIVARLVHTCADWHAAVFSAEEVARDSATRSQYLADFEAGQPGHDGFSPCGGILSGDVAYIWIPATTFYAAAPVSQAYIRAKGAAIAHVVEALDERAPSGWIIDLRQHSGGSDVAGLIGLHAFLPKGRLFGFAPVFASDIGEGSVEVGTWIEWDGKRFCEVAASGPFSSFRHPIAYLPVPEYVLSKAEAPVAVLTSGLTASAAEMILVALRQNPHVRVFGEPTAGVSTNRLGYELSDGSHFLFSTEYLAAPDGHVYWDPFRIRREEPGRLGGWPCVAGERIQPDVAAYVPRWGDIDHEVSEMQKLGPDAFLKTWYDPAYMAALAWIRGQSAPITQGP